MYLRRCTLSKNTASTDIIQVVQILCRIATQFVKIKLFECLNGLTFQTNIIIIGRVNDGKFCLSIV